MPRHLRPGWMDVACAVLACLIGEDEWAAVTRAQGPGPAADQVFFIRPGRHWGRPFFVQGVQVRRFDPVIELHINHRWLARVVCEHPNPASLASRIRRDIRRALPELHELVNTGRFRTARVLRGATLIRGGAERFGFQVLPIERKVVRMWIARQLRNGLCAAHPPARSWLESRPDQFVPKWIAIAKDQLGADDGKVLRR
ncbi:MAG: hypothetical protein K6T30_02350 [Alicyclobacillus sp.]|nr:hypothetical protein [Alicyclobacillus sp.]